jgi:hypothetical protein
MEPKPGPAGWFPVWIKAVAKSNEQTFVEITDQPDAVSKTVFLWIFIATVAATIVIGILQAIIIAMGFSSQMGSSGVGVFVVCACIVIASWMVPAPVFGNVFEILRVLNPSIF